MAVVTSPASIAFLFSAQGFHYPGMGKDLYERFLAFARAFDECDSAYTKLTGGSPLKFKLWESSSSMETPDIYCAGTFAVQVALVALLRNFGVEPCVVLGYSFGEYAASVCSGVLSIEDAMTLVVKRAQLVMSKIPKGQKIELKGISLDKLKDLLQEFETMSGHWIDVIGVLAPESFLVGGSFPAMPEFELFCERKGVELKAVRSKSDYAYHTRAMDPILKDLGDVAATLKHSPPLIQFISSSTGQQLGFKDFTANYWTALTRNTIQFEKASAEIPKSVEIFVEIGPSPILTRLLSKELGRARAAEVTVFYPMAELENSSETLLRCISQLASRGVKINWKPWNERSFDLE